MDESKYPSVDIFLPRYKEPCRTTVQSALDLHYPAERLTVWVLDDGRHDPVQQRLQVSHACAQQVSAAPLYLAWHVLSIPTAILE